MAEPPKITPDMYYTGQKLSWDGREYNATSGNFYIHADPKSKKSETWDYRSAANQGIRDFGPIPEGLYWLSLKITGDAKIARDGQVLAGDGIQSIPGGEHSEWGANRVHLHAHWLEQSKIWKLRDPNSFYIHDSHKGYTHGCVEVDNSFFSRLRSFAAAEAKKPGGKTKLWVRVDYKDGGTSTLGKTKK